MATTAVTVSSEGRTAMAGGEFVSTERCLQSSLHVLAE